MSIVKSGDQVESQIEAFGSVCEDKKRTALLSHLRYGIETVLSQWCQPLQLKAVHARDIWHLANRLLRAMLCHTLCITLTYQHNQKPLQFAKLLH